MAKSKRLGRPALGPRDRVSVSLSVDPALWKRLQREAARQGVSASSLVSRLIEERLARR